ncbi:MULTISPECIES: hypothetical protein [unclassified Paenibacillus]|uniref:hypothetical protein n=1 Tax=unclassified Paenibacillus TaxID=185978 RepID=UPI000CFD6C24|nr:MULTISPECIES: hypothetical protein [unclassified Paenibacillus]PRA08684.1 hypothetical protein CQ043_01500 [Paenibacillus sp. MYb63]QZN78527.1 hypothetical protein K5K90_15885 [Paenibacillus sp. DR312]
MLVIEAILFRDGMYGKNGISKYSLIVILTFILGYIVFLIWRLFFTKPSITLERDHVISTRNHRYDAAQIECIYVNYRRIGIKLYGKRLVPIDLCFYFRRGQDSAGVEAVHEWAAKNNKEIKHKLFQTLG